MHVCPNCGIVTDQLDLEFNFGAGTLRVGKRVCMLSPRQLEIIECLVDRYPRPVSIEDIFIDVYGHDSDVSPQTVYVTLNHIRDRLAKAKVNLDIVGVSATGCPSGYLLSHKIAA